MSTNLAQLASGVRGAGSLANLAANYNPSSGGGALSSVGNTLGEAANGIGVLQGINQGGVSGYGSAALNAGQLANKAGAFGQNNPTATGALGTLGGGLQIYNGIKQGGVAGYGAAGVGALQAGSGVAQLAGNEGLSQGLGQAASFAAIPLDVYNEINNWKSGATVSDAEAGATTGAAIGSVVPVIGTAFGALAGGALGALSSLAGPGQKDPETAGVQNLIDATGKYGNTQQIAANVQDPYVQLAGLMDERSSTLPEYQQYGRMGEQKFATDMTQQINQAVKANPSLANNPEAVYNQVVAPWVSSMNKNGSTVGSTYAATNQGLLQDMTSEYLSGNAANDWKAVGGDEPFQDIYQNSPIQAQANLEQLAQTKVNPEVSRSGSKMARGGSMKKKADSGREKRKSILDSIRPNFSEARKTHFADGGSYTSYANYANYTAPNINSNPDLQNFQPSLQDPSQSSNLWNQSDLDQYLSSQSDPANANVLGSAGNSPSSSGGGLGSLAKQVAPYAALLPLLSAAASKLGGSGSSSSSSTPAGQSASAGPFQAQASPRTANAIDPNTDWYTYGQHPETQFFSNNSIAPLMGSFVSPQASQPTPTTSGSGSAPATSTIQPITGPRPSLKAEGGALDALDEGQAPGPGQSRHVRGEGDGTSDDIDAKLSDGEYVIDANTVSMLGNGSNEAGAKRLDQLRENLRKHAAKPMAKGKQFMKAKEPMAYMKGGKKKPLAFNVEGEG